MAEKGRYIYSVEVELPNDLDCEMKLEVEYTLWPAEAATYSCPGTPAELEITSKRIIDYSFYIFDGVNVEEVEQSVADRYIVLYNPLDEIEDADIEEAIREHLR